MMDREDGNRDFPVWLLGDSNPKQWQASLKTPFDSRHPVRHNIWTPVLDVIQDKVFREHRLRIETKRLYIRNAVDNSDLKPRTSDIEWGNDAKKEVSAFRQLLLNHKPKLLLSFGAFSFEFARRALGQEPMYKYGYWSSEKLGEEFKRGIARFDLTIINTIPLLHRVVSGGKFNVSQGHFVGQAGANYFEFVGDSIADKLLQYQRQLPIWIS